MRGGDVLHLDFAAGRYVEGESDTARIVAMKAAGKSKNAAARALGIRPGGSRAYRRFSDLWDAV